MHPDTLAAIRLMALALVTHPEDMATLAIYGDLPSHLLDVVSDWIDTDEEEEEE